MSNPSDFSTTPQEAHTKAVTNNNGPARKHRLPDLTGLRKGLNRQHFAAKRKLENTVTDKELDVLDSALAAGDAEVARLIVSVADPKKLKNALKRLVENE